MFWWTILWPFQLAVAPSRWSARVICPPHSQQCSKSIRRVEHDSVALNWASTSDINQRFCFADQLSWLSYFASVSPLVANWLRGYCQGNLTVTTAEALPWLWTLWILWKIDLGFNGLVAAGFSFFNQPIAAEANYYMFWKAVRLLLTEDAEALNSSTSSTRLSKPCKKQIKKCGRTNLAWLNITQSYLKN